MARSRSVGDPSRPHMVSLTGRLARKQGGPSNRRKTVLGPDDHPVKDVTA